MDFFHTIIEYSQLRRLAVHRPLPVAKRSGTIRHCSIEQEVGDAEMVTSFKKEGQCTVLIVGTFLIHKHSATKMKINFLGNSNLISKLIN